jgi:hypothetical protein
MILSPILKFEKLKCHQISWFLNSNPITRFVALTYNGFCMATPNNAIGKLWGV